MITDGLNPLTVLLFVGAVLGGGALIVVYVIARVIKREPRVNDNSCQPSAFV